MREIRIRNEESGQRLDKFLSRYLPEASSGFLYKMLRKKNITVNREKADGNRLLQEGDCVTLFFSEETIARFQDVASHPDEASAARPLDARQIVHEDAQVLIVNKPAGMLSQRATGKEQTLTEAILAYLEETRGWDAAQWRLYKPGPINRLDRNTSGLVVVPLSLAAAQTLAGWFRDRALRKEYLTFVHGRWERESVQKAWLRRAGDERVSRVVFAPEEGAVPIEMHCRLLASSSGKEEASLLSVDLKTGKTHQIRAHLQALGNPVFGDPKYGTIQTPADRSLHRQALHAWRLTFPQTEGVLAALSGKQVCAPLPDDLDKLRCRLQLPEIDVRS